MHRLLLRVGRKHPQALIYPSPSRPTRREGKKGMALARRLAGRELSAFCRRCAHQDALVEQALLVSTELIRVAILWGEMWHEALEQAYRRYFFYEAHGVDAMLAVLEPLAQKLDQGATTANEQAFVCAHGAELAAALEHCREFAAAAGRLPPPAGVGALLFGALAPEQRAAGHQEPSARAGLTGCYKRTIWSSPCLELTMQVATSSPSSVSHLRSG